MKHKILIIDDEKSIRDSVQTIFSEEFSVFTASEGKEGVEILKRERPLLVFLDITMPGLSGFDVLELIKTTQLKPIIWMLTGDDNINIALKTLQMGATGYLTKPFNVSEIREIAHSTKETYERKASHDTSADKPWRIE
ncbi:MAG: response regulator [Elusimicrobia bacterium]|nr:response regulator [Elusimicrobiota bacterium]